MGGHPFSVLHCAICAEPIDLTADLSADENGKAVHEDCYVKSVSGSWLFAEWQDWQTRQAS
jgi:hypothetical protein